MFKPLHVILDEEKTLRNLCKPPLYLLLTFFPKQFCNPLNMADMKTENVGRGGWGKQKQSIGYVCMCVCIRVFVCGTIEVSICSTLRLRVFWDWVVWISGGKFTAQRLLSVPACTAIALSSSPLEKLNSRCTFYVYFLLLPFIGYISFFSLALLRLSNVDLLLICIFTHAIIEWYFSMRKFYEIKRENPS